jgi:hypothetical protein
MRQFYNARKIVHDVPSILIGIDPKNNYHCFGCIKISANEWAVANTGMRSQLFDVCTSDVLRQICIIELYENIKSILAARASPAHFEDIKSSIEQFCERYEFRSAGGVENLLINASFAAICDRQIAGIGRQK